MASIFSASAFNLSFNVFSAVSTSPLVVTSAFNALSESKILPFSVDTLVEAEQLFEYVGTDVTKSAAARSFGADHMVSSCSNCLLGSSRLALK